MHSKVATDDSVQQDGRPVYIEQLGKIDLKAMYKITSEERMLQNLVVEYEKVAHPRLPACSRKQNHLLETCCTIMDLKGVGLTNVSSVYGYVQKASAISQNYYPERLGKLYLINAPWGFSGVFSVIKKFLDPVTVEKIHVLGSGYKSELLAQIPKENLPKEFGGECVCPGDGCMLADQGPWKDDDLLSGDKWLADHGLTRKHAHISNTEAQVGEGAPVAAAPSGSATAEAPAPGLVTQPQ